MLLSDLDMDTVDFVLNFDSSLKEPSMLPARIPYLLLNGSFGIMVGMATNIPPHNLGELVNALYVLIHNPDALLQELLEYMPRPDFPTRVNHNGKSWHLGCLPNWKRTCYSQRKDRN
nr:DNA gyrase subunit A, chloroplastic/mitochondrial [Tanacetum cinerariifolium]GFA10855.1 DNA gyrase subunit A, chloroplastic/mitochondrial [Tanacetum cinerariifolium]